MKRKWSLPAGVALVLAGSWCESVCAQVNLVGSWTGETQFETNGFNYTPGAGNNRIALVFLSSESTTNPVINVGSVTLGGQTLTAIESADGIIVGPAGDFHGVLWLGYLTESQIQNMSGNALNITWDQAPNNPDGGETMVQAATYENVHQVTPIVDSASNTANPANTIQAGPVDVGTDDRLIYVALEGYPADHTAPSGYTEQLEQDDVSYTIASVQRNTTTASQENPTASWTITQRLAIISAVLNFAGCDYIETYQSWTATSADTWETKDLSVAPFNVPANAVLEVEIRNSDTSVSTSLWGGVRAVGSSLDRRFDLHQPWVDGYEPVVMHVQSDSSSRIQHYSDNTSYVDFVLLGYWECGTYVETFDTFTAGASATWTDKSLCSLGVGANHVTEMVIANNGTTGHSVGVRTNGSAVDRRLTIDRGYSGADNLVTMFVETDSTAQSTIELYASNNTDVDFYLVGYWSVAPRAYTELFTDAGTPSSSATWQDKDLTASGVPDAAIAEFVPANEYTGGAPTFGVRANSSSLSRFVQTHRIADSGANVDRLHVATDATATVEWYHSNITLSNSFYVIGYWDSCDSSIEYAISDLGAVTASYDSLGWDINSSNDVVGFDEDASGNPDAWFSECGSFSSLGVIGGSDAEAHGVNDSETVVGWSDDGSGNRRAFTWTSGGGLTNLGVVSGWTDSEALGINASGEAVGTILNFGAPPERRMAFLYLPSPAHTLGAGMNVLGTLGGVQSVAMDINDSGQVTGGAQPGTGQYLRDMRPFRWANGSFTNLGTLGGENESILHRGEAINASGNIAGMSFTSGGDAHAFYWNGSMTDIGVLTGGDTSRALGISDSDDVVGMSNVTGGAFHAFIWNAAQGLRDLNDLIDAGAGWTLIQATGINNNGQITGWGTNGSGDYRAFLLTLACSAGGGGAVAFIAQDVLATGAATSTPSGGMNAIIHGPANKVLGQIAVETQDADVFTYRVAQPTEKSNGAPGPGSGTTEGFADGMALPRTLTVTSGAQPKSFKITVVFSTSVSELSDHDINLQDAQLFVLDTTQKAQPGVWQPAGTSRGEMEPTGMLGDCGYVLYGDSTVDFWAVRDKSGIFAVGKSSPYTMTEPQEPIDLPPAPMCGIGLIIPGALLLAGFCVCKTRRG